MNVIAPFARYATISLETLILAHPTFFDTTCGDMTKENWNKQLVYFTSSYTSDNTEFELWKKASFLA